MLANVSSPGLSSRIVKYGNENMNWTKSSEQTLTHHPLYKRNINIKIILFIIFSLFFLIKLS